MAFLSPARSIASLLPSEVKSGERMTRSWLYPPSVRRTHAPEPRPMPTAASVARRTMPSVAAILSASDSYFANAAGSFAFSVRSCAAASSGVSYSHSFDMTFWFSSRWMTRRRYGGSCCSATVVCIPRTSFSTAVRPPIWLR